MSVTTLLRDATATIYLDGLIYLFPNSTNRMCRALVHTGAAHHALQIEIKKDGADVPPPIVLSPKCLRAGAPFWLYVDEGEGRPSTFSTSFYETDDLSDKHSFGHVLDFERLYDRALDYHQNAPAVELNFAHGAFYSANNGTMALASFAQDQSWTTARAGKEITSSVLVGVDFDSRSDEKGDKHLVLEQANPTPECAPEREIFRLKLEAGSHYLISMNNTPVPGQHVHGPDGHFLKYYDLFTLQPGDRKFLLQLPPQTDVSGGSPGLGNGPQATELSPPCNVGSGGKTAYP